MSNKNLNLISSNNHKFKPNTLTINVKGGSNDTLSIKKSNII